MSTPSGFKAWCEENDITPFHPEQWSEHEQRAYQCWKLAHFRTKWHQLAQSGDAALIRQQSGRAALINTVGADLREALRPLGRNPWGRCPCHPHRFAGEQKDPDPWANRFVYGSQPRTERALVWLRQEFGR